MKHSNSLLARKEVEENIDWITMVGAVLFFPATSRKKQEKGENGCNSHGRLLLPVIIFGRSRQKRANQKCEGDEIEERKKERKKGKKKKKGETHTA